MLQTTNPKGAPEYRSICDEGFYVIRKQAYLGSTAPARRMAKYLSLLRDFEWDLHGLASILACNMMFIMGSGVPAYVNGVADPQISPSPTTALS